MPKTQLEYLAFDMRPAGVLGSMAWVLVIALALGTLWRQKQLRALARTPVALFGAGLAAFYFLVFWLYGDDLFLFAPNLVLPIVLFVIAAYAQSLAGSPPAIKGVRRAALGTAAVCVLLNSSIHVRDLLAPYM
jgi:hypothetical protein